MLRRPKNNFDIAIIGGGHSGLTTLALLAEAGFSVACIDTEDPKSFKGKTYTRTTAVSYGSSKVLAKTKIWNTLLKKACPIKEIKILDGSQSPVLLKLLSSNAEASEMGWVIDNNDIKDTLYQRSKKFKNAKLFSKRQVVDFDNKNTPTTLTLDDGAILTATLIIGADGRQSMTRRKLSIKTRQWDYKQNAVISFVTHSKPHNNTAIEHFYKEGPFAILPMCDDKKGNHRSSIIWAEEANVPRSVLSYDEDTFLLALKTRFPEFYGDIISCTKRLSYPLNFLHAETYIAPHVALIADAAHGIHPIAGQGLNIGMRDIDALTSLLIEAKNKKSENWYSDQILQDYQRARRIDNMAMAGATDKLNTLFENNLSTVRIGRKIGLRVIDKLKPAKDFFIRRAMGDKSE